MSYLRILPRDAFNEANLLKCIGQIALLRPDLITEEVRYFDIVQNESDGTIHATNVWFLVGHQRYLIHRPLNSRNPWPVYIIHNDEDIEIFNDNGNFTFEILALMET